VRGNPGDESSAIPKRPGLGATRGLAARHRRRMRESGRLDNPSPVKPEMRDEGQPKFYITGVAGGGGSHRGNSEPHRNRHRRRRHEVRGNSNGKRRHSQRTGAKGQPEDSGAGSAERERIRGNPEPQPGRSGKMQEAGQPATSSTGRSTMKYHYSRR
jgi:hypothetical protein